ncbi:hypothetical protein AAFN90_03540 [Erwiniaceae bacterium CAU 1747]
MNRTEHERLTAQLIGEAAFALLKEKGPINKQSLIRQLQRMEASEVDSERVKHIAALVANLSSDKPFLSSGGGSYQDAERHSDNVYQIFGEDTQYVRPKKH